MKFIKQIRGVIPRILLDSFKVAFAILGGIGIVLSFTGYSLEKIGKLPVQIGLVFAVYLVLVISTVFLKRLLSKNEITLNIRGMIIIVKEGDLLSSEGWKLIPFNEYFDTQVNDIIISHGSLNGIFIDSLSDEDKEELNRTIEADNSSPLNKHTLKNRAKTQYELGTIKVFRDIMMLALTHFNDQNEAYTNRAEYEHTLRKMWREISRTYQGKSINLPLVGGGLTRLNDMTEKPNMQLLYCMLCTLHTSNIIFDENVQITVLLTKKALETIDLYELRNSRF